MNVTLAMPEELVAKARAVAAQRGTTLNQLIRELVEEATGAEKGAEAARQLREHWARNPVHAGEVRFSREETYAERMK